MKKIKVIDLLNMIANEEEVPEKIKYCDYKFEFDDTIDIKDYALIEYDINFDNGNDYLFRYFENKESITFFLNTEVEIIEDKSTNEIEKFEVKDGHIIGKWKNGSDYRYTLSAPQTVLALKMLEIIDVLNELKNKENE